MKKKILWVIEFLLITSVGIITSIFVEQLYLLIIPIVGMIIIKCVEIHFNNIEKIENVRILLDYVWRILEFEPDKDVRLTFHKPSKKKYKQMINYIPNGNGKDRTWNSNKGLVGVCIEKKKLVVESFNSDEEFKNKMITKYNYSASEIQEISPERKSYLCYPILNDTIVEGILFFDSVQPNVFNNNADDYKNKLIQKVSRAIQDAFSN